MKRFLSFVLAVCLLAMLTACGSRTAPSGEITPPEAEVSASQAPSAAPETSPDAAPSPDEPEQTEEDTKTLVAYFSATGSTENIARYLETILHADLYEIVPQQPYTSADLDYGSANSRAEQEINDPDARPAISGSVPNMDDYNVVFIGYPIWWGQAPKIISTFLESYDFSGKTIVPFCTSASSGISGSLGGIQALAPDADWLEGQRFSGSDSQSVVEDWIDSLPISQS